MIKTAKQNLIKRVPLMKCFHKEEFKQRLQWLSEGMLQNHIEQVLRYKINESEIEKYKRYKKELNTT